MTALSTDFTIIGLDLETQKDKDEDRKPVLLIERPERAILSYRGRASLVHVGYSKPTSNAYYTRNNIIFDFATMEISHAQSVRYDNSAMEILQQYVPYENLSPISKAEFHKIADAVIKHYKEEHNIADFKMPPRYEEIRKAWDKTRENIQSSLASRSPGLNLA